MGISMRSVVLPTFLTMEMLSYYVGVDCVCGSGGGGGILSTVQYTGAR